MNTQSSKLPRRLFVSCLGTTPYTPVQYLPLGDPSGVPSDKLAFIQVARLRDLEARELKPDQVRILTTSEARVRNVERAVPERQPLPPMVDYAGMGVELSALGFDPEASLSSIPNGERAEELWTIFETILNDVQEGDEVYVDVTHGFRSLSVVLVTALQFALRAKKAQLVEVSYGAFEAIKPATDPTPRPTFDLTPFFVLNDWTDAVAVFRASRDLRPLAQLAKRSADDVRRLERREAPRSLGPLASALTKLADTLAQTRLPYIADDATRCKTALLAAEDDLATRDQTKPIRHLLHEVAEALDPLCGGSDLAWRETRSGYSAAQWWLAGNSLHAAATLLREALVSAIEAKARIMCRSLSRAQADSVLGGWSKGAECNESKMIAGSPEFLRVLRDGQSEAAWKSLTEAAAQLVQVRNALDHAFTSNGPSDPRGQLVKVSSAVEQHFADVFGVTLVPVVSRPSP